MIPNYHQYHITLEGHVFYAEFNRPISTYISDVTGYKMCRMTINGKETQKRVNKALAEIHIPNPENLAALYVEDELNFNPETDYWCTTYHLRCVRKAEKEGLTAFRPVKREAKTKKTRVKSRPKPQSYPIPKGGIANSMAWK